MIAFNKVILAGYLTRDIEVRYTPGGTAVGKTGLAVNRSYKTDAGEKKEEVLFINLQAWGKTAEHIGTYLGKGSPVLIEGYLKLNEWEDKQSGQKRRDIFVNVDHCTFLGTNQEGGEEAPGKATSKPTARSKAKDPAQAAEAPQPDAPDDVPFRCPLPDQMRKAITGVQTKTA